MDILKEMIPTLKGYVTVAYTASELSLTEYLHDCIQWKIILSAYSEDLFETEARKHKFEESFFKPDCEKNRLKASSGLIYANRAKVRELLGDIRDFSDLLRSLKNDEKGDRTAQDLNCLEQFASAKAITLMVKEAIDAGDGKFFTDLGDIIRSGMIDKNYILTVSQANEKGGEYSDDGLIWGNFCKCIAEKGALPTKAELRILSGFPSDQRGFDQAKRCFKRLGLQGLL